MTLAGHSAGQSGKCKEDGLRIGELVFSEFNPLPRAAAANRDPNRLMQAQATSEDMLALQAQMERLSTNDTWPELRGIVGRRGTSFLRSSLSLPPESRGSGLHPPRPTPKVPRS